MKIGEWIGFAAKVHPYDLDDNFSIYTHTHTHTLQLDHLFNYFYANLCIALIDLLEQT